MKFRMFGIFSLFVLASILIIGCPGNSPTTPAAPTATPTFTDTPCMNASGTPCTSTPTLTFTDTATDTATGTPTSTPTVTDTPTLTDTPTNTLSPTPTGSATGTFTQTGTPSSTPTATASNTPAVPTGTPTLCPTQSFTPTPSANGYSISGTVNYTGSGTVNGSHPIQVAAFQPNGGNNACYALVTSNNGSYTIQGLSSGNSYVVVASYDPSVTGYNWPPPVGAFAALYGTATCNTASASPVTVTGNMTVNDISFDATNILNGFAGTAGYSGSHGRVDGCHGIFVKTYPAGTGISGVRSNANWNNESYITTNGGKFNMVGGGSGGNTCASQTQDILAYYDLAQMGDSIQTGDPYVFLGSQASGPSPSFTISLTDSQTY